MSGKKWAQYFRLLRVKHYTKNLLIFIPLIFDRAAADPSRLMQAVCGFAVFSLLASSVYIINDIKDRERDRLHPEKRMRPLASGEVNLREAAGLLSCCLILSMLLHFTSAGAGSGKSTLLLLLYLVLNIGYSVGLKDVPILDIMILASGFLIRVLYGADVTGVVISGWLFLTVLSAAVFLGLGKRRNEFSQTEPGTTRSVLVHYSYAFLDRNMYMFMTLANMFYALWAREHSREEMLWTVPLIMAVSMRYSLDLEKGSDGDPVEVILHDHVLLVILALYAVSILVIMYRI